MIYKMSTFEEYTEGYGKIEPNLINCWNENLLNYNVDGGNFKNIFSNLDNNKYIIHQFEITDKNTYCHSVFIDNYSNYYIINMTRNAGPYQCTDYRIISNPIINNNNTKYKLSNKIIDNIKKIKYYHTGMGGHPNPLADNIYFDMLDIIKNIIVSQSEEILLIPQIKRIQVKNEKLEERINQQNELISKLMDEIYDLKNKN